MRRKGGKRREKKKCIEEARKQQTRPMERKHANNDKEAHPEAHDNKERQKNLAEAVKIPVKVDEMTGLGGKATNSHNEMVVITDERPAIFGSHCQENIPNSIEESYQQFSALKRSQSMLDLQDVTDSTAMVTPRDKRMKN
ncbi:unnamed protein product [Miscanthus lutarioriparius]|uniref:Uncharacterized protein n=1 Tax=Miscanthus lutarioriparius TaxID=422564 RepID=A0A811QBL1_9POAL|nr:unnamed protein product [Miscanthus lutarioriparius]